MKIGNEITTQITKLAWRGLLLATLAAVAWIPVRNAFDIATLRNWGPELWWANIRNFESPVYISLGRCGEQDPPWVTWKSPSAFDGAKSGVTAVGLPPAQQLLIRRGAISVDGRQHLAVEAIRDGKPFRAWLAADACARYLPQGLGESSFLTPIRGPLTDAARAHRR